MTSPFHIRQPNTRPQGLEYASFDSTRTDLSVNSRDVIIGEQWVVLGRIGEGSFGEVFEAEDVDTGRHYAIKREPIKMHHPQIKHESTIYDVLAGGPGIPQCHWHGQHEGFDCIVIDLLGPNLNQLREATQSFSIDVVVDFGCQMVTILEHIHKRGLVYRDVKPDNFLFPSKCHLPEAEMVELPDDHGMPHIKYIYPSCGEVFKKWDEPYPKLYVVDFGLTTWWRNPATDKPYPEAKKNIKNKTGTARYASLNVHRGKPHSRRDDIEGMGYLLLDLIFGTLPWTGIQARNSRAGWDRMRQIKEDTFMSDLCAGLPQGFLEFIEYARKIKFAEEPNYDMLRQFLSGSVGGGKYSSIVRSPFGGHTERKWMQDIEKDSTPHTREDMPRPNVNNNDYHYYEPQHNQFTNTAIPPRQRRPSYNQLQPHRNGQHDDAGVFDMDEMVNNLQHGSESISRQQFASPQRQRMPGGGGGGTNYKSTRGNSNNGGGININYNNNGNNRCTSRDFGCHEPSTTTGPSSFQKLVMKTRKKQKRVGWNSHKHDQEPWIPETDWETTPVENPDINIIRASWGDNKADGMWGDQNNNKPTWGIAEEEGSWAAKVDKPWE